LGDIDQVAVYGNTLSSTQVATHFSAATTYDSPTPTLTSAQVAQATSILTSDSRFTSLMGATAYSVASVTPWVTTGTGANIGAILRVTWNGARTFTDVQWPSINYDESETTNPPYATGNVQETFSNVIELEALVDLNTGQLVQLNPAGAAEDAPAAGGATAAPVLSPGCVPNLRRVTFNGDWLWNYDFGGTDVVPGSTGSRCKVDNPVTLIFGNNADVNKAKTTLVGWTAACDFNGNPGCPLSTAGSLAHMRLRDGNPTQDLTSRGTVTRSAVWDQDRGALQGLPCVGTKYHYRVYAPSPGVGGDDRFYNLRWGYYVIGTSHVDFHEACFGKWSGESEITEQRVVARASAQNLLVFPDEINMYNALPLRQYGHHRWLNDGFASRIQLP
jgi:hypothetical protein